MWKDQARHAVHYGIDRMREPTSWLGFFGIITSMLNLNVDQGALTSIAYVLAGLCGLAAVYFPEK